VLVGFVIVTDEEDSEKKHEIFEQTLFLLL
jgi:hypothetical protein